MSAYALSIGRPPRTHTERELQALLRVTGQYRSGFRDHVLINLVLATGLRSIEAVSLNLADVFDAGWRARTHIALSIFKGTRGKRAPAPDRLQHVVLPSGLRTKLEKYVRGRLAAGEAVTPESPLFVSRKHRRLSTRQVRHLIGVWQKRAGLERHLGFHTLRHDACSGVYRRSKDIRLTQRFARHRSLNSTVIYAHPTDDDLIRVVEELQDRH